MFNHALITLWTIENMLKKDTSYGRKRNVNAMKEGDGKYYQGKCLYLQTVRKTVGHLRNNNSKPIDIYHDQDGHNLVESPWKCILFGQ